MNDCVTIMWHDARDPYAESSWKRAVVPHQRGTTVKHYLQQQRLIGQRMRMSLRRLVGDFYARIRMTYVPQPGDVIALVPKGW